MEPSVKKLLDELESLRRQRLAIDHRANAIQLALNIMGIRVNDQLLARRGFIEESRNAKQLESKYAAEKPFQQMSLNQACLKVLEDHSHIDVWLDKRQVEYLLTLGGYQFKAKSPTSSVEVTLRRLAASGQCEVQRGTGPHGSGYRAIAI